jgi:cytoskeletal protein CcmA (bactofilin family)
MALVLNDRVKETTTTTGQDTISLGGAATGFETFVTGVGDTNTTYYIIVHESDGTWEIGIGTIGDASPDTLARTTVIDTSAGNTTKIDFAAGSKTVFCTLPSSKAVFLDADGDVTLGANLDVGGNLVVTGTTTFNGGTLTLGDANTDNIVFGGEVDSNIIPDDDNTYDLGSSSKEWKDIYIDGTAYLDAINFDGTAITSTAAELNILDGVTASATDINLIDGITNGTVIASKAIITDSNKDITGGRNITITGELDAATLDISGDADIDGTLEADAITVDGTALSSVIAGTTVTLASTVTVTDSTANTNFPVVFHNESNGLLDDTGALRYNPSTGELLVPKLTVAGTTTTVDTVTMQAENAIIFEGATADAHETTLTIVDPTGDRTINLPNVSGTLPVLAAASTTQITSTPEELNILDGVTSTAAELNILDGVTSTAAELNILDGVTSTAAELNVLDGITAVVGELNALDLGSTAVGTAIASKAVILDSNKDYTGIRNLTITGELDGATLDISGNADIDGTLEADAITIGGTSTDTLYASPGFAVAMAIAL